MPWRAVTLQVDAGAAEAMSDALMEAGAQSVSLEHLDLERPTLHALIGLGEDAERLVMRASHAAGLARAPAFSLAEVADEDWVRRSQAQFPPVEIGRRLWIGPSWHQPTPGRIAQTPRIGDGVTIGAGATVIGAITVGDGAFVGAGVLLAQDLPARAKATLSAAAVRVELER